MSARPLQDDVAGRRVLDAYPERANLYPLRLEPAPGRLYLVRGEVDGRTREELHFARVAGAEAIRPTVRAVRRALQGGILAALRRSGYRVSDRFPLVVNTETNYSPAGPSLRIHPAFRVRVRAFGGRYYLCLDHRLVVRAALSLAALTRLDGSLRLDPGQRVLARSPGGWIEGRLVELGAAGCQLALTDGGELRAASQDVIPELTRRQIDRLAPALRLKPGELERSIKQLSFLTVANAPRARLDACTAFAARLAAAAFPIPAGGTTIGLEPVAAPLRPPEFAVGKDLEEVAVAFDHADRSKRSHDILSGLTRLGAYDKPAAPLRLVVLTTDTHAAAMERLVDRLNRGAARYPGARKTFGSEMVVRERLVCVSVDGYEETIRTFVRGGARAETDLALVYLPKIGDTTDPHHPYFRTKGLLVREGLTSQMVDEATVLNPDWRDLNLALNVYAKAGHAPWVLDEAIPGVDLFIGLSSSQVRHGRRIVRMMGYVNVFDTYGRWRFYQGDTVAFSFEDRLRHYEELVRNSVAAYRAENGGALRTVHIHLTKPFSVEERAVLARAVRAAAPGAVVAFVWVNPHHGLRLYDLTAGGDGSIDRATYLRDDPGRLYLATTGTNVFQQRGMGTPVPLELTVWADPAEAGPPLRDVGQLVLSLTRLNWASTRSFCHEPITTKYAGDTARLMAAFMEDPSFTVNPGLRGTPWFL